MAKSRALVIGKLALLIGGPILIIGGLVVAGVHWGDTHRAKVLEIEHDWFGLDVELVQAPGSTGPIGRLVASAGGRAKAPTGADAATGSAGPAGATGSAKPTPPASPAPTGVPAATGVRAATGMPAATAGAAAQPVPQPAPQPVAQPPAQQGPAYAIATRPELPPALEASYAKPRVVTVKVLVDAEFIKAHPTWLRDVDTLMAAVSANYDALFGVQLRLYGVVEWRVAGEGLDAESLHGSLRERPREGADVLLGITGRPLDATRYDGWSDTPGEDMQHNTSFALVYAVPGKSHQFMRATMHELAHLFGALDASEPGSEAWQAGSFMSYAFTEPGTEPVLDPENLARVLRRKDRPFEPEGTTGAARNGD